MSDPILLVHCHHEAVRGSAFEFWYEPIENRIACINADKPEHEKATRLRLLRVVPIEIPAHVVEAWNKVRKAWVTYQHSRVAIPWDFTVCDQACAAYLMARDSTTTELNPWLASLDHDALCPAAQTPEGCPWDGKTIFPEKPNA